MVSLLESQTPPVATSQTEPVRPTASSGVREILDHAASLKETNEILTATDSAIKLAEESGDHEGLALAYRLRAKNISKTAQPQEASVLWQKSAAEFEKAGDRLGQIESLSAAGILLLKSNPAEAEQFLSEALAVVKAEKRPTLEFARAYVTAGDAITETGQFSSAKSFYAAALDLCKELAPNSLVAADAYEGLGRVSQDTRQDLATPLQYFESSLRIGEEVAPDSEQVARIELRIGNVYGMTSDFSQAAQHYERSIKIYESLPQRANDPLMAGALNGLGIIAARTGNYFDAQSYFERALAVMRKHPENADTALTLVNLGNVAKSLGDLEAADNYTKEALSIGQKLQPGSLQVAGTLMNLGTIAQMQGDYVSAEHYFTQSLVIAETHAPNSELVALELDNVGELAFVEGDLRRAVENKKKALEIYRKVLPGSLEEGSALNSLGEVAARQGNVDIAWDYDRQALAITEKIAPKGDETVKALLDLARLASDGKQYDLADEYYRKALAIDQSNPGRNLDVARILQGRGDLSAREGHLVQAIEFHAQALALLEKALGPDHPDVARELNSVARLKAQNGDPRGAFDIAVRAESIGRAHLRLTMQGLSERQALLYESTRPAALDLLLSLLDQGAHADPQEVQQAWTAVLQGRALVFDEMAGRRRSSSTTSDPGTVELVRELTSAKQRLANLTVRGAQDDSPDIYRGLLDRTRDEVEGIERNLSQKSQSFRQHAAREQLGLSNIGEAIPDGAALVAYVRYSRMDATHYGSAGIPTYAAFTLPAGASTPSFIVLGKAKEIETLWSAWNDEITKEAHNTLPSGSGEATYRRVGTALRRTVWDPASARIGNARNVFLVPDGTLSLLNLDSLPKDDGGYLAEDSRFFHYLTTERDLTVTHSAHGSGMLAFGNPNFDQASGHTITAGRQESVSSSKSDTGSPLFRGSRSECGTFQALKFAPLPGSGHEAEEVSAVWNSVATRVDETDERAITLIGSRANELAFRELSPGKRVLHLATHGFFLGDDCHSSSEVTGIVDDQGSKSPTENPLLLSGLAFAGANHRDDPTNDGIVTSEEIAVMDLNGLDLAVLSACDTGRGQIRAGEGVFGLRRAFQLAGAKTVVMSLWPVDDEMTDTWMQNMYREWLVNGKSTSVATQLADREILRERRARHLSTHPFYWAGFIASGNNE
jgi:tetratricopeptide (TPR) repeat protein